MKAKYICILLIALQVLIFSSCCSEGQGSHAYFYYRVELSNNDNDTYHDLLTLTNYRNGSLTIKEFEDIANKYIDSTSSDRPIHMITFVGQRPCESLPPSKWDYLASQSKHFVVTFRFPKTGNKELDPVVLIFGEMGSLKIIREPMILTAFYFRLINWIQDFS